MRLCLPVTPASRRRCTTMSSDHLEAKAPATNPKNLPFWALLFAGMMLLMTTFTFIVMIVPRPRTLEQAEAERRAELIGDRVQKQRERLATYGWVDEKTKKAHIPVDVAMKQFADEAQKAQK